MGEEAEMVMVVVVEMMMMMSTMMKMRKTQSQLLREGVEEQIAPGGRGVPAGAGWTTT